MSDRTLPHRREGLSEAKRALLEQRLRGGKTSAPKAKPGIPRRAVDGPAPLSFAQQRLWLLDQIEPGLTAYNLPLALRIEGPLDVNALERAVAEIARRHDALRTTFLTEGDRPVQRVEPLPDATLSVVDLAGISGQERARAAQELASMFARSPFDLRQGPLWRAMVVRLGQREHLFLLTMHHIITDAWSLGVFARELAAFYAATKGSTAETLPPLPIQYTDVAAWEREHLPRVLGEQLAYWKKHLTYVPALDLPTDRSRPAVPSYEGGKVSLKLPRDLAEAVEKLSCREEATPFMTLLTAFQVLLHRLSGQDDFAIGVPIAGRGRREMEGLIGFFVSTLALRADLSGAPSFREALQRTRQTAIEAYARQEVPFEKIVEEVQPERDLSRTPIFQVMFNHLREVDETRVVPQLAGLKTERVPRPDPESKFDLTLYAIEEEDGIHLDVVYSADLFESERMEELLRQYRRLLEQVVEKPETAIDDFSLVTKAARAVLPDPTQTLFAEWKGSVAERLTCQARQRPDQTAVVGARVRWSYAELEARSNRLAHYLGEQGLGPGDTVAIYAHRSAAFVEAVLGVHKAGAAFLLLDPAYPAARLIEYLRQAQPSGWFHLAAAGDPPGVLASFVQDQCRVRLSLPADEALADLPTHPPDVRIEPDAVAYVTFTSGSTGKPKGIVATHRPLGHFLDWHTDAFGFGPADRFSLLSGLAHDPLLRDLFAPLWAGATLCIPEPKTIEIPGRLGRWMQDEAVTVTHLTPAMSQLLAATAPGTGPSAPLSKLRYAFFGGDALAWADVGRLRQQVPAVQCVNFYGATETPQGVGCYVVPESPARTSENGARPRQTALPLGRGIEGVQLLIVNAAGAQAGIGEVG
ncbi:MAG: non-ribosomal peptide synthetase, partial [Rhodothermales bacterium]